jgi:hypothetical protein
MAAVLVANTAKGSTNNTNVTSDPINTTGASLIVVAVAAFGSDPTLTDNKGNTWTSLTVYGTSGQRVRLAYCSAPIVGTGHTFALAAAGGSAPALAVSAWTGVDVYDGVVNGAFTYGSASQVTGSITPAGNNRLVLTAFSYGGAQSASGVSAPFTILTPTIASVGGATVGCAAAYESQTTATARSATWTLPAGDWNAATIAAFAPAGPAASVRVTQEAVEVLTTPPVPVRVTQAVVEVLGEFAPLISTGRLTQLATELLHQPPQEARVTQYVLEVLGGTEPAAAAFENATITTGLTYMRLRTRSGVDYYWSDRPLPDPHDYEGGWKGPRVLEWGKLKRALSGFDGQYETTDFVVMLDDTDRLLRELDRQSELVNATVLVKMLPDDQRRRLVPWTTVYHGVVREGRPTGTLRYELTVKDPFAERFAQQANPVPERVVTVDDFPNCTVDHVASSAVGYVTTGSAAVGAETVTIDSGSGSFAKDDEIVFAGDLTIYRLAAETFDDPETTIQITPGLVNPVAAGTAVTVRPSHQIQPAVGRRVPFWYGHITDRVLVDGADTGDGQAPLIYVGDRVLSDDRTYGEFLWAGHACFSPDGKPIPALYFWNENLDDLHHDYLLEPDMGGLDEEADVGGRIALPGWPNWSALGYSTPYVDYHGRRYTVLFLRGIFRDWALGLHAAPPYLGGVPFAADAYGCETHGDASGPLITDAFAQYLHVLQNWVPPRGHAYQSGAWAPTLMFVDDPTIAMIHEGSFAQAQAQSIALLTASGLDEPAGFRGDFGVGITSAGADDPISARDLIARLNVSFGVQAGFSKTGQFLISMPERIPDALVYRPPLTWERDVFAGTFSIEASTHDLYSTLAYRHTRDFFDRVTDGWRSITSGVLSTSNDGAIALYGADTVSPTVALACLRGHNRDGDADEYLRGSNTATCVLALLLARYSLVQHLPTLQTGPAGFDYELGDVFKLTHYEGLSAIGWIDRALRIERIEVDPATYTTTLETYDIAPILMGALVAYVYSPAAYNPAVFNTTEL